MTPHLTHGTVYKLRCGGQAVVVPASAMPAESSCAPFALFGWILVCGQYRQPEMWTRTGAWAEDGREHNLDLVLQPLGRVSLRDLPPVGIH